jgi:hypothetical protein
MNDRLWGKYEETVVSYFSLIAYHMEFRILGLHHIISAATVGGYCGLDIQLRRGIKYDHRILMVKFHG